MSVKRSVNVLDYCINAENCFVKKDALVPAYKIVDFSRSAPSSVNFAGYSRAVDKYFACNGNKISYSSDGQTYIDFNDLDYNYSEPFLIEDYYREEPRAVIISGYMCAVFNGNGFYEVALDESLSCGVMHCGRLFGAYRRTIKWSADGFDDWNEGIDGCGHLNLDADGGDVLNMLVFGGKLVAVREYGLTFLNMNGSPEKFSVGLTYACDMIGKNTSCIIGNKLYFYSASGLKCFDGTKISPLETLYELRNADSAVGYDGIYFVNGYVEDLGYDVILCFNTADGTSAIVHEYARKLFVKDGVLFFTNYDVKKLEKGGDFRFESGQINFGTDRFKTVTQIKVNGPAQIMLYKDRLVRVFETENGIIRPRMRGKEFKIIVDASDTLNGLTLTAEVPDAV